MGASGVGAESGQHEHSCAKYGGDVDGRRGAETNSTVPRSRNTGRRVDVEL
jgi:hypothetical protein